MIIANWKCNGSIEMILSWFEAYNLENDFKNYNQDMFIGLALPSIYLNQFDREDSRYYVKWGVQDVDHADGSRTGAISVDMLIDNECDFSIIGHSERRQIFNEDNDLIKEKLKSLNNRVMTVLCIGETKEENDKGITKDILKDQLEILNGIELDESLTVAYEPVWAIGSGITPEPKDINEIHKYIKDVVQSNSANNLIPKVLYGGSVTDKNAESFFVEEFVDGALVGGASLDGSTFAKIVNIFNSTK
ncbi:MAG: triose-phosphate isomerase [Gammaproteobacteria bacterium]|nr:triose-phosphate isomerase [Gammaproteobacteria bacterium]|tara:strand:- start:11774 stop:12514 length:741 start_codon:yes stop_codon:yes gene_type:complete